MPKPQIKPAVLRESWRPNNVAQLRAQKQQLAVRLTFTALLCGLVALSLYLIFAPLFHPTTRLYFLTAGASSPASSVPVSFFQDDALRFLTSTQSLTPETATSHLLFMESPEAFQQAFELVTNSVAAPADVAVVQLSAHPLLINGRPYLRCDNFTPNRPLEGAVACEELFDQLSALTSGHVLLLLDTGCPTDQQSLFFDEATFFDQLEDMARDHASGNYTIILSHSLGERSYRSTSLECSVFTFAASLGLSGMADLNHDRSVTVDELYRFIAGATQAIVQNESGAAATQHPQLLGSRLDSDARARLAQLVVGSAPPAGSNKLAEQYKASLGSSLPGALPQAQAPAVAKDAQPDADQEQKSTFQTSLNDYVSRKSEELGEDLRNDLNLLIIGLPKPLARGVRRSVDEAQKLAEKSGEQSADDPDKTAAATTAGDGKTDTATTGNTAASSETSAEEALMTSLGFPDLSAMADSDAAGMVRLAWEMTAYLERTDIAVARPMDLAPVAWLRWRSNLHAIEERIRAGAMIDEPQMRLELTSEILGAYQLASGKPATVGANMKSVASELAPPTLQLSKVVSLGLAGNLQQFALLDLSSEVEKSIAEFDRCLTLSDRQAMDKWLTEVATSELNQMVEVHTTRMLLGETSIPWPVVQSLLKARRDYERLISHPLCNNSATANELTTAQRHLLQATRLACDHIRSNWNAQCVQSLALAQSSLTIAERQLQVLLKAWQWRNQVLLDAPAIVAWQQIRSERLVPSDSANASVGWTIEKELPLLVDDLAIMSDLLKTRESIDLNAVESHLRGAQQRYALIQRSWQTEYEGLLARNNDSKTMMASDAWVVDALLASTLVIGPQRQRLLEWRIKPARLPELSAAPSLSSPAQAVDSVRDQQLREALFSKLAKLGGQEASNAEIPTAPADVFSKVYVAVPGLVTAAAGQSLSERLQSLREADLWQRLVWQSPPFSADAQSLHSDLWRAEFAVSCNFQRRLSAAVVDDALQDELRFLPDMQTRLTQLEASLSGQKATILARPNQLIGQGPSRLSLITSPEVTGRITWKNAGTDAGNVWLVVDYDHDNLELVADTTLPYYTSHELPKLLQDALAGSEQRLVNELATNKNADNPAQSEGLTQQTRSQIETIKNAFVYPVRPLADWIEPSAGLAAGQSLSIPFKVRRIGTGVGQSKIVWKLISDREYVRYEIPIDRADSKQLRLISDGPTDNWTENTDGLVLHPWPNRATDFRVGLINQGSARVVSLELLRLAQRTEVALPNGFVDAVVSRQIVNALGNLESLQSIPDVSIPQSQAPYWLTMQAEKLSEEPEPNKDKPAAAPSLQHGMIVVLTDKESGEKLWRRIDFRVRHPRGYVEPRVRYDAVSQRVVIQLRMLDGQKLPAGGVSVHGECLSALPSGTERRLDGLLTGTGPVELVCQIAPRAGRTITMALDIDRFPRAFVFDVPCWQTQNDIPLALDKQRISIVQPKDGLLLPATVANQVVNLQVDAYPGSFANQRDTIEVGWDLDRDREFTGESTVKVRNDRGVDIDLLQLKGDRLIVNARVKDLEVTIPAPALRAANVNLLARMSVAGETVWSEPLDVVADDQPPVVTGIELTPDVVVQQGVDMNLTVGADDRGLSGLAAVQLQVNRKLNGLWDAAGEIVQCERNAEGSWAGVLPTKELIPGRISVLVMAMDRAGNASELRKTHFELLSVDEWQARQASVGSEVTGSISYSGGPLGGAKLTLENGKGEPVYQARSNPQGIFQFPKVAVGKYKLVGTGVAKNRPRRVEAEVEIKELPARPVRLQLQAK